MNQSTYETHIVDPLLPFIFHTDTTTSYTHDPGNWHGNLELLCCISGAGEVKLNSSSYPISSGDIVVINPDVLHASYSEEQVVYHCLIIDESFCQANGLEAGQLQFDQLFRDDAMAQAFERLVQLYLQLRNDRQLDTILHIRHEVLGILCALYSGHRSQQTPKENFRATQRVKSVVNYIRQNIAAAFTLEELAERVGISKFHLTREFRATTGLTVFAFINLCRCTEAKRMIEEGTSVSDAAISCGFENLSYFTRTFKKQFGEVPSSFLKQKKDGT